MKSAGYFSCFLPPKLQSSCKHTVELLKATRQLKQCLISASWGSRSAVWWKTRCQLRRSRKKTSKLRRLNFEIFKMLPAELSSLWKRSPKCMVSFCVVQWGETSGIYLLRCCCQHASVWANLSPRSTSELSQEIFKKNKKKTAARVCQEL